MSTNELDLKDNIIKVQNEESENLINNKNQIKRIKGCNLIARKENQNEEHSN